MSVTWPAAGTSSLRVWAFPTLIACIGFIAQNATYLNHDVAWVLYDAGRMLDGAQFGTDIVAANPPLVWWISEIPAAMARIFDLPPDTAMRLFVSALAMGSLVATDRFLQPRFSPLQRSTVLSLAAFFFFAGAHRDFGQREHMALILTLPYILAAARRMRGEPMPPAAALAVGIAAGIGFAFKPHLLAVPVALELLVLWHRRSLTLPFRIENIALAAVVIAYVGAVFIFAAPYVREVIPAVTEIYWAFNDPMGDIVSRNIVIVVLMAVTVLHLRFAGFQADSAALVTAAAAFFIAALVQSKGYTYHLYPALACAMLSLTVAATLNQGFRLLAGVVLAAGLYLSASLTIGYLSHRAKPDAFSADRSMTGFVAAHVPEDGSFLAFSTHPYPGFPTALYANRAWSAKTNSRLSLPAIVRLREDPSGANRDVLAAAERMERAAALTDLAGKPDLILVATGRTRHAIRGSTFDFLAFYLEDPAFRAVWSQYREIGGAPDDFRAFVRIAGAGS